MPHPKTKPKPKPSTSSSSSNNTTITLLVALVAVALALGLQGPPAALRRLWMDYGTLLVIDPACQFTRHYPLGTNFEVRWDHGSLSVWPSSSSSPPFTFTSSYSLWHTYAADKPFVLAARAEVAEDPIRHGHYFLKQKILEQTTRQTVDAIIYEPGVSLTFSGTLSQQGGAKAAMPYIFTFSVVADDDTPPSSSSPEAAQKLHFVAKLNHNENDDDDNENADDDTGDDEMLYRGDSTAASSSHTTCHYNRILLRYASEGDEAFFGFGQHYSRWNLKGAKFPVMISEQGVGRGLQPLTWALNAFVDGVGSNWHTTYVAKPMYLTNHGRCFSLRGPKVVFFDLTLPEVVTAEYWSCKSLRGLIYNAANPLDAVRLITSETGRMKPLPAWTQRGVIAGLEGGSEEVQEVTAQLRAQGVPLAGIWLQDWVGTRYDWDGTRLIWNWEVNRGYYPEWDSFQKQMATQDIRVLTYINPYLVDVAAPNKSFPHARNLFREAVEQGFLIKDKEGQALLAMSGSIEFGTIDPTNPGTREWLKAVIKEQMIAQAGSGGWMADFGEYVPFQSQLYGGKGNVLHNLFPDYWASLQREAVAEAGRSDDILVFIRSGYIGTSGQAQLYWVGDQLVTWDAHDGIKTVLPAMLSGGLMGNSLSHSDVGGYTMIDHRLFKFFRPRELLFRWVEMGAFAGVVYRTHLGSFKDTPSAQVWDDADSMAHFARFGRIFALLAPYREVLMEEAAAEGYPVVRPLFLHFPKDPTTYKIVQQFLLGPDLLVAPVLDPGMTKLRVYLPGRGGSGREAEAIWRHVWTGQTYDETGNEYGAWVTVPAGLGQIPVFYRVGSRFQALFESIAKQ